MCRVCVANNWKFYMRAVLILFVFSCFAAQAWACGPGIDCKVGERHYRISLPDSYDGKTSVPVLIFAHGYRGSAAGVMRNRVLRRLASDLGAALIAVKSSRLDWDLPNSPSSPRSDGSVEFDYFDAVVTDAATRFAIDENRIVASGFSAGGMMVWNLACTRPERYAGFIPIAGTFWKAPPKTCAQPVANIIHIHGDQDSTVPLLGRPIGQTTQGRVPESMKMYSEFGDFGPATRKNYEGLACKERTSASGAVLDFCLFSGGHSFRTEHLRHGWMRLKEAGRL